LEKTVQAITRQAHNDAQAYNNHTPTLQYLPYHTSISTITIKDMFAKIMFNAADFIIWACIKILSTELLKNW